MSMRTRVWWSAFTGWHAWRDTRIPRWSPERIARLQQARISGMVRFAYRHVPHYREAMEKLGLRPGDFRTAADLAMLPLISKKDVAAAPERFRPAAGLVRAALTIQSSGTSGKPSYIDYDARALFLSLAASQRRRDVTARFLGGGFAFRELTIARLGSVSTQLRDFYEANSWTPRRLDLTRLMLAPSEPFPNVLERMNAFRPHLLSGYGSYIGALLRWAHAQKHAFHRPKAILYGADCMPENDRLLIEEELGVPVLSSYQSVEALRIAFQCEERRGFHIDSDQVVVRVVDANGATLPPGVPGEVVISNLTNRATVLLNYRQGDVAAMSQRSCECGRNLPMLESIQGREDDLVRLPGGSVAHPLALMAVLQRVPGVVQVQLVQEELRRFRLRAVCAPAAEWTKTSEQLQSAIRSLLGHDIRVDAEPFDRIPCDPSGKTRAVISLCRD